MLDEKEFIIDGNGKWQINEDGTKDLIEPSEELIRKRQEEENNIPTTEPTQEERILALEQALLNLLG